MYVDLTDHGESFLRSELSQAWLHYRHLENTRTNYLGFFVTVFLAGFGFLLSLLKDRQFPYSPDLLISLSVSALVLFFVAIIIVAVVIRIGHVLSSYETILKATRDHFWHDSPEILALWDIRAKIPPSVNGSIFSVQKAGTYLVTGVCIMLIVLQAVIAWASLTGSPSERSYLDYVPAGATLVMAATMMYVGVSVLQARLQTEDELGQEATKKSETTPGTFG